MRFPALAILVAAALSVPLAVQAEPGEHRVELVAGTCAEPGEVMALLSDAPLDTPVDEAAPAGARILATRLDEPVAASFMTIPLSLSEIVDGGLAMMIIGSEGGREKPVACGEVGGFVLESADLQVGLAEVAGSGTTAVSWLEDNGDGTTTISILVPLTGSVVGSPTASGLQEVAVIERFFYVPNPLEIVRGTTVTWTNEDETPHTVTATDGTFDSGFMALGDTYTRTFDAPGTFKIYCVFHPRMRATVIVD